MLKFYNPKLMRHLGLVSDNSLSLIHIYGMKENNGDNRGKREKSEKDKREKKDVEDC